MRRHAIPLLLLAAACSGSSRVDVAGVVVGSAGLPVEGARVSIAGRPAVLTDASGRFAEAGVEPPYVALVGIAQPEFQRAFAAAWLGLSRPDPVLALANGWPQAGAQFATACGAVTGDVTFPASAPWVLAEPSAPFGSLPHPGHVDPGSRTYCAGAGWIGGPAVTGAVHVLAVETAPGAGADFLAVGFPAAGTLAGVAFASGARTDGADVALAPAIASPLLVRATGEGAEVAQLFLSTQHGPRWPGGGIPLAGLAAPQPWPEIAAPILPGVSVRAQVYAWPAGGVTWRERTLSAGAGAATLALPRIPVLLSPPEGAPVTTGTRFTWTPGERGTAEVLQLRTEAAAGLPAATVNVYAPAPDVRLPDLSAVGVQLPPGAVGDWWARTEGPLRTLDDIACGGRLGLALHHGIGEPDWATAASATRTLVVPAAP